MSPNSRAHRPAAKCGRPSFSLQIARAAGATVICLSSSDDKLEKAKQLGASHVINYRKVQNWEDEVLRVTNGEGVDYVVEVCPLSSLSPF